MSIAMAMQQLKDVHRIVVDDVMQFIHLSNENTPGFISRSLIRTFFISVEALAFQLRQVILSTLSSGFLGQLSSAEVALLREERYVLNKRGEADSVENFQSALPSLLFTIRCYVKSQRASFSPDLGNHGWEAMQKLVLIRNRLTHPKAAEDLSISEEETKVFLDAFNWWHSTMGQMFIACNEAKARRTQASSPDA